MPNRFRALYPIAAALVLASFSLLSGTAAGQTAPTAPPELLPAYGPHSGIFLLGGRGLLKPLNPTETLFQSTSPWTISLWFHPDSPGMTTLLAGFGDPAQEDSRFLGLRTGKPVLRIGYGHEIAGLTAVVGTDWHYLAATFDGMTAHLYLDGAEVASGTPVMGLVEDPELMLAPDFLSSQGERYAWDQPHLPPVVPSRLREWQHFGGTIADFRVEHTASAPKTIQRPNFETILYEDGSKAWFRQETQLIGYIAPQPPNTLPISKAPFGKPAAQPLPPAGPTLVQTDPHIWTIARNWKMQAAPLIPNAVGAALSAPGAGTEGWYDATIPGTVLTTYIDRGVYPDPNWDLNNLNIPESLNKQNYWYRVEFPTPDNSGGKRSTVNLNGINYAAQVWFNGRELGTVTGAFIRGIYDVTNLLKPSGQNVLAVRISPPPHPGIPHEQSITGGAGYNGGAMLIDGPTFVDTEGWDWIPAERDRDSGIWQDVTLHQTQLIQLGDPQITTELPLPKIDSADVSIGIPLENFSPKPEKILIHASFEGGVSLSKEIEAAPGKSTVTLTPAEFPQLHVKSPRLWWPNGYGKPELYHLQLGLGVSDQTTTQFGIRQVTYEASLYAPDGTMRRVEVNPTVAARLHQTILNVTHEGMRQTPDGWASSLTPAAETSPAVTPVTNEPGMTDLVLKVNGVRIAARGGNWGMEDALKRISREHLEPFFRLHQIANVNIIRNWMGLNDEPVFYDLADQYGLMVWNDFWESTENWNAEAEDPQLWLANARDTVRRYRNHPSIVMWCGRNEGVPQPIVNTGLDKILAEEDGTRYYSPSSNRVNLRDSGPYKYQDPKLYFNTLNRGFSVELGIPSFSTLESFQAWIAPENQWPVSDAWAYHDWHQSGNGDVHPWHEHLDRQFGAGTSLPDFERKAQMLNYTLHRAIFEGFNAHLWAPNSGRMIWMTQPAWPSNMWQMFTWDYDTQASFYGVMHASEPRHVQLDLSSYDVAVTNTTNEPLAGAHVEASVYGLDNKQLFTRTMPVSLPADSASNFLRLPLNDIFAAQSGTPTTAPTLQPASMQAQQEADAGRAPGSPVFVRLRLLGPDRKVISTNFYWLADREEDMRRLNDLPPATVTTQIVAGAENDEEVITATLTNGGKQAALQLKLTIEDAQTHLRILPAYYSDNYISLLPGESETVTIHYPASKPPAALGLRGYNLPQTTLFIRH